MATFDETERSAKVVSNCEPGISDDIKTETEEQQTQATGSCVRKTLGCEQDDVIIQFSDIKFEVEEEIVHASKGCLSFHSPVLHAMFTGNFKEKTSDVIPLPGKPAEALRKFVAVTPLAVPVSEENLYDILPIAAEYQCGNLLQQCDHFLQKQEFTVLHLSISGQYGLQGSLKKFAQLAGEKEILELREDYDFARVPESVMIEVYDLVLQRKDKTIEQLSLQYIESQKQLQEMINEWNTLKSYKFKLEEIVKGLQTNTWQHSSLCVSQFTYNGKCKCRVKQCEHKEKNHALGCVPGDTYLPIQMKECFKLCFIPCKDCVFQTLWHVLECLNNSANLC